MISPIESAEDLVGINFDSISNIFFNSNLSLSKILIKQVKQTEIQYGKQIFDLHFK